MSDLISAAANEAAAENIKKTVKTRAKPKTKSKSKPKAKTVSSESAAKKTKQKLSKSESNKSKAASKKSAAKKSAKSSDGSGNKDQLIIVESPAKARTLEKYSRGRYKVLASMGHVRDLPKSVIGIDLENRYEPRYITIRGKKDVITSLKKYAKNAVQIFLASDPDREGEAIAWHLANLLKVDNPLRIEMHEITKEALNNALENPRPIDINRVNAQQARRILDRLVGYNLSPLLWRKITGGLSAGRVQSVAVRLICDRQREIDAFVPQEYWTIGALTSKLERPESEAFESSLVKIKNKKAEIPDKKNADKITADLKKSKFIVKSVTIKEQKKNPVAPFRTSTLQQEANKKLGFRASKTMMLAQQLYEGIDIGSEGTVGLITYMRTDSVRISPAAREEAERFILQVYGEPYCGKGRVYAVKGKTQDAHEAIRPTSAFRVPEVMKNYLKRDQYRLYKLIWDRFIASQMSACVLEITSVDITAGEYLFRATDSKVKFPGYTKLYENPIENDKNNDDSESKNSLKRKKMLPPLAEGEELTLHKPLAAQHFTQPPPSYTEAALIKTLEENGIGRPSTYAPIVETIRKRGYTALNEKKFFPTELGYTVNDLLQKYFPNILDVDFTADLENKLDSIEEGSEDWVDVIDKFYKPFSETLSKADELIPKIKMEPKFINENCENCGEPLQIKRGRFGEFIACTGYPQCKYTRPILKEIGVPCPEKDCDGQIVEKRSRKGIFFGCSKYPQCTFASWNKPLNEKCPRCGKNMVLRFSKQGRGYKTCIDSSCQKEKKKQEE